MTVQTYSDEVIVSFSAATGDEDWTAAFVNADNALVVAGLNYGPAGYGTILEIAPDSSSPTGYASTPTPVAVFDDANGGNPLSPSVADSAGDLFGVTRTGGVNGYGTVYEIVADASSPTGYDPAPVDLVSFNYYDGITPLGGLTVDSAGDLIGTTYSDGSDYGGEIFEVAKDDASPTGYATTPTVLANFTAATGYFPLTGAPVSDSSGDLFGTLTVGGDDGYGAIYELAKDDASPTGYAANATQIASFNWSDGDDPTGQLVVDASGDLIGATYDGGSDNDGVIFEIVKDASSPTGYDPTPVTLANFDGEHGAYPYTGLVEDAQGNLYGTTQYGGAHGVGVVFELAKDDSTATGYDATPTVLYSLNGSDASEANGLTLTSSGELLVTGQYDGAYDGGALIELSPIPCYCSGTRLLTERGEVAVERLAVGDLAVTASGSLRPIVWIGHREIEVARHRFPLEILPVRVRAGAFGGGLPHRDLWLSPQHAVYVDGVLIPIARLANGASIAQMRVERVAYFHIELESHDVLLAEGLPAESFLDCNTRSGFSNAAGFVELHPTFRPKSWADACAPLKEDGELVGAVRRRLLAHAQRLGFRRSDDPEVHIVADGRTIRPQARRGGWLDFALPADARALKLVSHSHRPADDEPGRDKRHLGVAASEIVIDGETVDLASLVSGWHPAEGDGNRHWRWTDGFASLPAGGRSLAVRLANTLTYWVDEEANPLLNVAASR